MTELPREYLSYPRALPKISTARKLVHIVAGLVFFPFCWAVAYLVRTPGLMFRRYGVSMGIRLLLRRRDLRQAYYLIVSPMDSVRHFEFDFVWRAIENARVRTYLDVSSPRLFPLALVDRTPGLFAHILNPDKKDLPVTISLANALGIADRFHFHSDLIETAPLQANSFDLITSISVLEHIPDDAAAIRVMWDLLKPGGLLLITVPCAAKASDEYINENTFGLLNPNDDGFVFWQRYYDDSLLRQRIFSTTGEPRRYAIYGETRSGSYHRNATRRKSDPLYPFWSEPLMMGTQFSYKMQLADLPGIGVIGLEFVKR